MATPSQAFNDVIGEALNNNQTYEERTSSIINAKPKTLGSDSFPSRTEVSDYWKSTVAAIPGAITGSATGRLTEYPNPDGGDFTESLDSARTPASGGFAQGTGTDESTVITTKKTAVAGGNTATASSVAAASASASGNSAGSREIGVMGGILGAVFGVVALL